MADYTEPEKQLLRGAAFGAVYLVANAEPGMMDMIKESFAASKSFAGASGEMQGIFRGMSMPKMPKSGAGQMEAGVLADLSTSVQTVARKAPDDVEAYRHIVLDACTNAAEAAGGGVSAPETEMLGKVNTALSAA